ncbi:MAG: tripartite tricarboxylate transporter substrate binding protein [Beijerinckiaceae bacterium]|nr:tripartite tricarboxylate transporter substrate binding protein [Beijerinckiaceae bacterium]
MTRDNPTPPRSGILRRWFVSRLAAALGVAAFCAVGAAPALAADWPNRTVTVIVPFPPGGNTDTMARMLADFFSKKYRQSFIVDNRPNASGSLATAQLAKSKPDGYTLMFGASVQTIIVPMLQKVSYDSATDLQHLSIFGTGPFILGARSSLPVSSLTELIAYVRANPGKLNAATASVGGLGHLSTTLLAKRAGLDVVTVPYRGGGPAISAMLAGETDIYFGNASELLQHKASGKLKLLAVSTLEPLKQAPEIQPVAALFPGFEITSWNGLIGPVGIPADVVAEIAATVSEASKDPALSARLVSLGIEPMGSTPQEFARIVAMERKVLGEAVTAAGLTQQP